MVGIIILAGGKGNRIGGDKPLIQLNDKPLVVHVIEAVEKLTDEIIVVTSNDLEDLFRELLPDNIVVLPDLIMGRGPLVGLYTGLRFIRSEWAFVLPCDSPFLNEELLRFLIDKSSGMNAVVPIWPNGYIEPLHSLYRVSATLEACERVFAHNSFKISEMITKLDPVYFVPVERLKRFDPELLSLLNINSEKDLEKARDLISGRKK
jgi:molybdopterin-guanine dinucleotide biosynthesis protein A